MDSLQELITEYKKQLEKGDIQKAYKGLMEFMGGVRKTIKEKHPDYNVSSTINPGIMDVTYFYASPETFRQRGLKIVILFFHETCLFEIWLCGYNKQAQSKNWSLFKTRKWSDYFLVPTTKDYYSILEYKVVENPDFNNPASLTTLIESGVTRFITDIADFLIEK